MVIDVCVHIYVYVYMYMHIDVCVCVCLYIYTPPLFSQMVYNTKGTRAHTHRELIREWLWEPKGSSLEYI